MRWALLDTNDYVTDITYGDQPDVSWVEYPENGENLGYNYRIKKDGLTWLIEYEDNFAQKAYYVKRRNKYLPVGEQLDALWKLIEPMAINNDAVLPVLESIKQVKTDYPSTNPNVTLEELQLIRDKLEEAPIQIGTDLINCDKASLERMDHIVNNWNDISEMKNASGLIKYILADGSHKIMSEVDFIDWVAIVKNRKAKRRDRIYKKYSDLKDLLPNVTKAMAAEANWPAVGGSDPMQSPIPVPVYLGQTAPNTNGKYVWFQTDAAGAIIATIAHFP